MPWFSFRYNPNATKRVANDMAFAPITMKSWRCIPYNIHNMAPALNWVSVNPLTSLTEWVVHILMICGTNPNMVNEAAAMPNIVHPIFLSFYSSRISQRYALFALHYECIWNTPTFLWMTLSLLPYAPLPDCSNWVREGNRISIHPRVIIISHPLL